MRSRRVACLELLVPTVGRMGADLRWSRQLVIGDTDAAYSGAGLASGAWGLALTFQEFSRIAEVDAWVDLARVCAETPATTRARGLFSGVEGQRVVLAALLGCVPPSAAVAEGQDRGDLMDGVYGQMWADRCVGVEVGPPSVVAEQEWSADGLAHGALGAAVATCAGPEDLTVDRIQNLGRSLVSGGWCNGRAGMAVAALVASPDGASDAHAEFAHEQAMAALDQAFATDGVCHGLIGALVVAAGVARATGDPELRLMVERRAQDVCSRVSVRGWRLERSRAVDASWLTGVAGMAWGLMAVWRQPLVNPLCPPDSQLGRNRSWKAPT